MHVDNSLEFQMITTIKSLFNNGKIPVMLKKKRDDTTVAEIGVDMQQVVETLHRAFDDSD